MTIELEPTDFAEYFRIVHKHEPFPWQQNLVNQLAKTDTWPDVLDLPTGSGKTTALDAAVFHLAMRANEPSRAALRIVFVVDRRLIVDDTYEHARTIAYALSNSLECSPKYGRVVVEIARRLKGLAGKDDPPLVAQRLRGGAPLEHDWARTPTQPTILCSTVDQIGSRLLFRGYGVSDRMKPVHAGLLGTGSLILLDEVHLAEPFRQTIDAVRTVGKANVKVALLSATPGGTSDHPFKLSASDRKDPVLSKRLDARKPTVLKPCPTGKNVTVAGSFAREARAMAVRLQQQGVSPYAVGIVVNRVALARATYNELKDDPSISTSLVIGRSRDIDRDVITNVLVPFRTNNCSRAGATPLFVIATQCLEVGVDLDLDGIITQAAPLDSLRQRFGRLNRAGRPVDAEGTILALPEDIAKGAIDSIYGDRIRLTWDALSSIADNGTVDFGVEALSKRLNESEFDPSALAAERPNAPVLMPAYLDLWSQTAPRPTPDPDVRLFLHGTELEGAGVSIVWRADISKSDLDGNSSTDLKKLMRLLPPRSTEAVEVPVWVAREWLNRPEAALMEMSDMPERSPSVQAQDQTRLRRAFRWAGTDDPQTKVVTADDLRPGDLVVVPAAYGGCDKFGWSQISDQYVVDVADKAAEPYWGQYYAVRISPDILRSDSHWELISTALKSESLQENDLIEFILDAVSHDDADEEPMNDYRFGMIWAQLHRLLNVKRRVKLHFPYTGGSSGGVVFVAERGILGSTSSSATFPATEDETAANASETPIGVDEHCHRVAQLTSDFAERLEIGGVEDDLRLAAYLHDAGKADPRFQMMLSGGDPWNRPDGPPLAKSSISMSLPAAWKQARLPKGWRHEALSVRMALEHPQFSTAHDPVLVLWLIGSHHGCGRPFFDFEDSTTVRPLPCLGLSNWQLADKSIGPQSLSFEFCGNDWAWLFNDLKRRYGIWGLAHLEAILRLADHRASEQECAQ